MTLTQLVLLAGVGLLGLAIASFLRLATQIQALLVSEKKLTEGLSFSLTRLSSRADSAEELAGSLQAQNADLLSTVTALRHQNREIDFLRSQVNVAHDRLLALVSRGALATVHQFNATPGAKAQDDRPPDGFSVYPTMDSPVDTIYTPDVRPPVGKETRVVPRPRSDSPDGYGSGGSVVLDEKTEQFLFGG